MVNTLLALWLFERFGMSLAAASPAMGGALLAGGWVAAPLIACGALRIVYDVAIWRAFRRVGPPAGP